MLRIAPRVLRVSRLASGLRTFSSIAADKENAETGVDIIRNFIEDNQVIVKGTSLDQYTPWVSFDSTPFSAKVKSILRTEGFEKPSPIQAVSWPIAFDKKDIISVAKTGSGKTLGFLLPGFHRILSEGVSKRPTGTSRFYKSPQVLVLAPTRELGNQIAAEASKYHSTGIDTVCLYGGASKGAQIGRLRRGADCVVATPGRCNDLIDEGAFDISQIRYLVLDEADRMLDMGFEPQIRQIIDQLPTAAQGRQTLFFTATWPKEVQTLAAEFLSEPVQINIGAQDTLNANKDIKQHAMIVKQFQKLDALLDLLEQRINVSDNPKALPKTIIFAATKASCDELQLELRRAGYSAAALHGDKSQQMRDDVMSAFRRGRVSILIATDIAARGLDVKDIENVVNFDFPNQVEDYVHRIGRTGRAGAAGSSYTFLNPKDLENRRNMSDLVGVLTRCQQEVPAPLEEFRKGAAKHSTEERNGTSGGGGGNRGRGGGRGRGDRGGRGGGYGRGRSESRFNGYGRGQGEYRDREPRRFSGSRDGRDGGRDPDVRFFDEARGGSGSGSGRGGGSRPVRYESFAFQGDGYDDADAARASMRAARK